MARRTLTGMIFGQLGRVLLAGHPFGCACASCVELDGHAHGLAGLLEREALDGAEPQGSGDPLVRTVKVTDVRVVPPSVPKALPAPPQTRQTVVAEVDGRPVRAELVRVDPAPPKPRKRAPSKPRRSSR